MKALFSMLKSNKKYLYKFYVLLYILFTDIMKSFRSHILITLHEYLSCSSPLLQKLHTSNMHLWLFCYWTVMQSKKKKKSNLAMLKTFKCCFCFFNLVFSILWFICNHQFFITHFQHLGIILVPMYKEHTSASIKSPN